jgi:hypothetical protein
LSEDDQYRDVYAYYGVAAYYSQTFEKYLINYLLLHAIAKNAEFTPQEFDKLESTLHMNKTLGALIKDIGKVSPFDDQGEEMVNSALSRRNFLVHHYFWHHAEGFMTSGGREKMLTELLELRDVFQKASTLAKDLCQKAAKEANIPWSEIQAEIARRLQELEHSQEANAVTSPEIDASTSEN